LEVFGTLDKKKELEEIGITHILTVASGCVPSYPDDFVYLYIDIQDIPEADLLKHFEDASEFMHEALKKKDQKVLVHCMAGRSRSVSCILAYLMRYQKLSLEDSLLFTQSKRPIAQPNEGFMEQLKLFQQSYCRVEGPLEKNIYQAGHEESKTAPNPASSLLPLDPPQQMKKNEACEDVEKEVPKDTENASI